MPDPDLNLRARAALRGEWRRGMWIVLRDGAGQVWDVRSGRVWVAWDRGDDPPEIAVYTPSETVRYEFDPDLDDRVTLLALVAVIEARIGKRVDVIHWSDEVEVGWDPDPQRTIYEGPTLAAALVAALEAT